MRCESPQRPGPAGSQILATRARGRADDFNKMRNAENPRRRGAPPVRLGRAGAVAVGARCRLADRCRWAGARAPLFIDKISVLSLSHSARGSRQESPHTLRALLSQNGNSKRAIIPSSSGHGSARLRATASVLKCHPVDDPNPPLTEALHALGPAGIHQARRRHLTQRSIHNSTHPAAHRVMFQKAYHGGPRSCSPPS